MKRLILAGMILGVAAAGVQTTKAGDHEWAVVGKVLTGAIVASAVVHAVAAEPVAVRYSSPCAAPHWRVVQPAPAVIYYQPVRVARAVVVARPVIHHGHGRHHHFRHGYR
jgi:hypothetical protein